MTALSVFLSWSGDRSLAIAEALREWLPSVLQNVEPFLSSRDIRQGGRWSSEIGKRLEVTQVGIFIVTPENRERAWLLFEAGAIAKLTNGYVCTYLYELRPGDVTGPLSQFQHTEATKADTQKLVQTINGLQSAPLSDDRCRTAFERWWPDLESRLKRVSKVQDATPSKRSADDMLEEVLTLVRDLSRKTPSGGDCQADARQMVENMVANLRREEVRRYVIDTLARPEMMARPSTIPALVSILGSGPDVAVYGSGGAAQRGATRMRAAYERGLSGDDPDVPPPENDNDNQPGSAQQ